MIQRWNGVVARIRADVIIARQGRLRIIRPPAVIVARANEIDFVIAGIAVFRGKDLLRDRIEIEVEGIAQPVGVDLGQGVVLHRPVVVRELVGVGWHDVFYLGAYLTGGYFGVQAGWQSLRLASSMAR